MKKSTKNGFYKLKTKDGDKWLQFSRLFITKLKEVTGLDIVQYGKHLASLDNSLDLHAQFDAITDLTYSAMLTYSESNGEDVDYDIYKVGEWLYESTEEDSNIMSNILKTLKGAVNPSGKKRAGRFTPPKKERK